MMHNLRRSDRLRNRIESVEHNNRSCSSPNLYMGRGNNTQGHLALLQNVDVEVDPQIADFIPVIEGNNLLNDNIHFRHEEINCVSYLKIICKGLLLTYGFIVILIGANVVASKLFDEYNGRRHNSATILTNNKENLVEEISNCIINQKKELQEINLQLKHLRKKVGDTILKSREHTQRTVRNIRKISNLLPTINEAIEKALVLYDADKIATIDYALETAGGYITSTPETIPQPSPFSYYIIGINIQNPSNPRLLIQPGMSPGECFAFKGSHGKIRIRLIRQIMITAVTLEHTHQTLVEDISSAPKDFKVYGLETADSIEGEELGSFSYIQKEKSLQTFHIAHSKNSYEHVELVILTNHGNLDYTCVYRFRVHGYKLE